LPKNTTDPMEMLDEKYDLNFLIELKNFHKNKNIENPKEYFKKIFDNWIKLTDKKNFGLLIASPYNEIGGSIKGLIVAVGKGNKKDKKEDAKHDFRGDTESACEPPFVSKCEDNSLFCYICKVILVLFLL
jgi:hypothetical protein